MSLMPLLMVLLFLLPGARKPIEISRPTYYDGWSLAAHTTWILGMEKCERHLLLRGDARVLELSVSDDGDENVIDDERWGTVWIQVPKTDALQSTVSRPVGLVTWYTIWLYCYEEPLAEGTVQVRSATKDGVLVQFNLRFRESTPAGAPAEYFQLTGEKLFVKQEAPDPASQGNEPVP